MFKNLTYKKKNLLLMVAALLTVFFVYSLGIKRTVNAYKEYADSKNKMEVAANAPMMAALLEKELAQMDAKLGNQNTKERNTDEALLGLITNYCQNNHAVLREFPQKSIADQGDMLIETNRFMIAGNYATLII